MKRSAFKPKIGAAAARPRQKKCRQCREPFTSYNSLHVVCSPPCALAKVAADNERIERKEIRQAKERIKTKAQHAQEAQAVVNRYVRLRDAADGCISCDKPAEWGGQWHASHFRSRGAAPHLRFNLLNIHKACSVCNSHLSGNLMGYRPKLIEKIGADRVEWLECNQAVARHDIPYLKRLKAVFAKKARRLEKRNEAVLT